MIRPLRIAGLVGGLLLFLLAGPPAAAEGPEDRAPALEAPADTPDSMREWIGRLGPEKRRAATARLQRMEPARRRRFFERWETLSDEQRRHLEARLEQRAERHLAGRGARGHAPRTDAMTEQQRERFRAGAARWREMDAHERERMRGRLRRFERLSPGRQEAMIRRLMPDAGERERARALARLRAAARSAHHRDRGGER